MALTPPPETPYNFLSLGAGVQSSTMALMAAKGEITPMPDAAIFADTHAEPQSVYDWLEWLEQQLPFPVITVSKGDLGKEVLTMKTTKDGRVFSKADIPFFTKNADGSVGKIPHRSCTREFKIFPITRKARELAHIKRGQKEVTVTQWIGISWDEIQRVADLREKWQQGRWPLIEMRMRRHDCIDWMQEHYGTTPPRSACVFCPFHSNAEWKALKEDEPEGFQLAVDFERELQHLKADNMHNRKSQPFLHRSLTPLDEVDLRSEEDKGQMTLLDECTGFCGV